MSNRDMFLRDMFLHRQTEDGAWEDALLHLEPAPDSLDAAWAEAEAARYVWHPMMRLGL